MAQKLAIFGISGRIGCELAKVAGAKGWEVRGFVRSTSRIEGAIAIARLCEATLKNSIGSLRQSPTVRLSVA